MEQKLAVMFENVRHELSLIIFLSLSHPDMLKEAKFTDHEINIIKNLAIENYTETGF